MTEPIESLGARVAGMLGWRKSHRVAVYQEFRYEQSTKSPKLSPYPAVTVYFDAKGNQHCNPDHITEWPLLMCEFNVWPLSSNASVVIGSVDSWKVTQNISIPQNNTPESRQQAATRAVLLAVEQILKERET